MLYHRPVFENRKTCILLVKYLDIALPTTAHYLACDEVLLELCEAGGGDDWLWFWEPRDFSVVLGYSRSWAREVHAEACRQHGIKILRRSSGGGTVLQGPGCLNYSLLLTITPDSPWQGITQTNHAIMERHRRILEPLVGAEIEIQGVTDLALAGRKFNGNAQRRQRQHLLFHGCFLLSLDLDLMSEVLPLPEVRPAYRRDRGHGDFVTNLGLPAEKIRAAFREIWHTHPGHFELPENQIHQLVRGKYLDPAWIQKF
jgi:lipoate-protein ligase A